MCWLARAVVVAFFFCTASMTWADNYPVRPVKLVIPVPPGGPLDFTARLFAERLGARLNQTVIVENKPGGNTLLAAQLVAASPPDGYTLMLGTASLASYPTFMKDVGLDVFKEFAFVTTVARLPYVLATGATKGLNTFGKLVEYAKTTPGKANFASYGNHSHITVELVNQAAGIDAVRIPYRGSAPAHTALVAGDIDYILTDLGTLRPLLDAKQAHLVAVGSDQRLSDFPTVPTLRELGLKLPELFVWYGLVAPAATPTDVVQRLNREVNAVAKDETFKTRLAAINIQPYATTPDGVWAVALQESKTFEVTAKSLGIRPE